MASPTLGTPTRGSSTIPLDCMHCFCGGRSLTNGDVLCCYCGASMPMPVAHGEAPDGG